MSGDENRDAYDGDAAAATTSHPPSTSPRTAGFAAPTTGVSDYLKQRWEAIKAGELGALPIILGLVVIVAIFGTLEEQFLTARNFTNLLLQMAPVAALAMGIVFVLLIADGEVVSIDLSVAFVAAVGGVVMTLLQRPGDPGWPWWACILGAVAVTTAIGLLHAFIITKLGVPSFITTLAGFLVWSGVVLWLTTRFSTAGTIRIQDERLVDIANNFLSEWVGWAIAVVGIVAYALSQLNTMRLRQARGLDSKPLGIVIAQIVGLGAIVIIATAVANSDRGVPQITITLGVFLLIWTFVTTRTAFGRHIYAVGGSPEATRRAGISVDNIRIAVFAINGFMAGVGGVDPRVSAAFGRDQHRRREPAPERDRRRGDRRDQPVRWVGSRGVGTVRRPRDHSDSERHGPARAQLRDQVHHHRYRSAACGHGRLGVQAASRRPRPHLTCRPVCPARTGGSGCHSCSACR